MGWKKPQKSIVTKRHAPPQDRGEFSKTHYYHVLGAATGTRGVRGGRAGLHTALAANQSLLNDVQSGNPASKWWRAGVCEWPRLAYWAARYPAWCTLHC